MAESGGPGHVLLRLDETPPSKRDLWTCRSDSESCRVHTSEYCRGGREHLGDYLRHLSIASGSLMELETHLLIAQKLNYVSEQDVDDMLVQSGEVSRMLAGLTKKLRAKGPNT